MKTTGKAPQQFAPPPSGGEPTRGGGRRGMPSFSEQASRFQQQGTQIQPSGYARPNINNYARRGIPSRRTPEPVANPNAPETMYGGPNTFGRRQMQRPYGMATMRPAAGGTVDPRAAQMRQAMMLRGR